MTPPTLQAVPDRQKLQTHAILLIVFGALCGSMIPSIFGIIALVQLDTNPDSARTMNKVGWIILWVCIGLIVLAILAYVLLLGGIFGAAILSS